MIALWHPANSRESRYRMQTPFCVWVRQTFGGVRIEQFFYLLNKCSVRKCVVILVNEWCLLSRFIRITWCRCRRVAHFSLFVRQIYLLARVSGGGREGSGVVLSTGERWGTVYPRISGNTQPSARRDGGPEVDVMERGFRGRYLKPARSESIWMRGLGLWASTYLARITHICQDVLHVTLCKHPLFVYSCRRICFCWVARHFWQRLSAFRR